MRKHFTGKRALASLLALAAIAVLASAPALIHREEPRAAHVSAGTAHVSAGTARMAARLRAEREEDARDVASITAESKTDDWNTNRPSSIPALREAVAGASNLGAHITLRFRLAKELLWLGKNGEVLEVCDEIRQIEEKVRHVLPPAESVRLLAQVRELAAMAFFRMAEIDNCVCSRNADSCIFPVAGGGVHTNERGSRAAIEVLTESLEIDPGDLGSRWLLNLAYMTLGEHPAKVPPAWLIPASVFAPERDIGRFRNVAEERGVAVLGRAGGCVLEDFDGDGRLDLVASAWGLDEQLRYFRNLGQGRFEERTEQAGLPGQVGGLNLCHADYNNDGHADVLVLRGAWLGNRGGTPDSLLRGNGDGTFDDVTEEAGLLTFHPGQAGAWADFDNDGWVDLFLGHEEDQPGTHPSLLYHNNQDGTFTEVGAASGLVNLGFVKGAAWGDYDNDNFPDLYVSRMGKPNVLLRNEGPGAGGAGAAPGAFSWRFRDVTATARVGEPLFSFASWFFDFDNDGWLDLFVAGFKVTSADDIAALYLGQPHSSETPRLYRNRGDGTFADVTREARLDRVLLVMGANFGDLDNDGFLDLYLGTGAPDLRVLMPNRMFRNAGGKVFEDVTTSGGFGHLQKGHGIAFGDVDADGDQDIYAVMGGWYTTDVFRNALFDNPGHGNHWITLRLSGRRTNRAAMGARIKVTVAEGSGRREVHAVVGTGGSFGSSSLQQEIGLGRATGIESIEVTWPATGKKQVIRDVGMDQVLAITEESTAGKP